MRALVALARDRRYVCTQHHLYEDCLVGMVKPETKIEIVAGRWGALNDVEAPAVLKTLRLLKAKRIKPVDHAIVMVGRPRQGTIMQWRIAGEAIANLVQGKRTKPSLSVLSPRQQEILCSEFLRLPAAKKCGLPLSLTCSYRRARPCVTSTSRASPMTGKCCSLRSRLLHWRASVEDRQAGALCRPEARPLGPLLRL